MIFNLIAQITNNAVPPTFGQIDPSAGENYGKGAFGLANIIISVWWTLLTLSGLATILYLILGGVGWLTAGGDKTKVEQARDRITQALIGMTIVFAVFLFVNFIGPLLGINLLKFQFPVAPGFEL